MINKITPSVAYNKWLKRLNTLLKKTNQSKFTNVSKVVKPSIRKLWELV